MIIGRALFAESGGHPFRLSSDTVRRDVDAIAGRRAGRAVERPANMIDARASVFTPSCRGGFGVSLDGNACSDRGGSTSRRRHEAHRLARRQSVRDGRPGRRAGLGRPPSTTPATATAGRSTTTTSATTTGGAGTTASAGSGSASGSGSGSERDPLPRTGPDRVPLCLG
ncbi:hypothetical protein KUTG_03564 [Kutzneria sp. 744]|nr:hypothetical protein KUTG_03564 [Kutzneria sp. 744]